MTGIEATVYSTLLPGCCCNYSYNKAEPYSTLKLGLCIEKEVPLEQKATIRTKIVSS